jgi:peptidoglycan/LPS O-acetylase OafA/YrhL
MSTHSIKSIQALRGIAACIVVLFHYKWAVNIDLGNPFVSALFNSGGLGVTIFFILSGFVMIYSSRNKSSAINFAINRFSRIYPAYLFFILLCFAIDGAMSTFHYADKTTSFVRSFFFLPSITDDAPAYINVNNASGVRWTLNYEMYFYLLMSLSFIFRKKIAALFSLFFIALVAMPAISGFYPGVDIHGYPYSSELIGFATNPIMYEFLLGIAIALLYIKFENRLNRLLSVLFFVCSVLVVGYYSLFNGYNDHGLKSSALFMAILFMAIVFNREWLDKATPKVLYYLGEISFSVYLLHNPMMSITRKYIYNTDKGWHVFFTALILTFIVSHLSHKYFEVKASKALRNFLMSKIGRKEQSLSTISH